MTKIISHISAVDWSQYPTPQTIVTSPPYWAKRRYPIPDQWFGGDADCEHQAVEYAPPPRTPGENDTGGGGLSNLKPDLYKAEHSAFCSCGAWLGQLGHEPTPQLFVEHLADILAGLPLADDGTMWVNIDDTYMNSGAKPKDLALVPERLALAMQERGFWVRSRIVWAKTNGMPQSVTDRPPHQYETIWLFTKSKSYKYNIDAVRVPCAEVSHKRMLGGRSDNHKYSFTESNKTGINAPRPNRNEKYPVSEDAEYFSPTGLHSAKQRQLDENKIREDRAVRDVWHMPTANSGKVHIAPMPLELAKRCILLSTDPGDVVLDPFGGTGTTAEAAVELGREAILVDIDERLEQWTGELQTGLALI